MAVSHYRIYYNQSVSALYYPVHTTANNPCQTGPVQSRTVLEICVNASKLYCTILCDLEEVVCYDLVMVDDRNGIQTTGVAGSLVGSFLFKLKLCCSEAGITNIPYNAHQQSSQCIKKKKSHPNVAFYAFLRGCAALHCVWPSRGTGLRRFGACVWAGS